MSKPKSANTLAWLFAVTYMFSYMTRTNFSAIVSEMEGATGITRDLLSMSLTGSFVTYGLGQIVSGFCGDRFSPKKLVTMGLIATVLMNLLLPLCNSPYQMMAVWCVNGFAQAFMWPPIVRLMVMLLPKEAYAGAVVKVSWGSSVGTILLYLLSPLVITWLGWRWVFWFCAGLGFLWIFAWNRCITEPEVQPTPAGTKKTFRLQGLFTPLMIGIMVAIVMQGMLRDGITTWMPTYIAETYKLSNVVAILSGVVMPIFSILCTKATEVVHHRGIRNPVLCAGVIFGIGVGAALLLYFLSDRNAALSVVLAAVITGCMHGVNLMLVSIVPAWFGKYGSAATASGVLNACTYVGSATSTYGIAVLSGNIGWQNTILLWAFIALVGTVLCLVGTKPWAASHKE